VISLRRTLLSHLNAIQAGLLQDLEVLLNVKPSSRNFDSEKVCSG
jgi:hypothetical protein